MKILNLILLFLCVRLSADEWLVSVPPTDYYEKTVNADWREVETLSLDVEWAGDLPDTPLLISFYIRTGSGDWLERREDLVLNGKLQRFSLSLAEDSPDWRLANGDRLFGKDLLRNVSAWGLRLFAAKPAEGLIRTGDLKKTRITKEVSPSFAPRELPESVQVHRQVPLKVEPRDWLSDPFSPRTPEFEVVTGEERTRLRSAWVQEIRYRRVPGQSEPRPFAWRRPVFRAWWVPDQPGQAEIRLVADGREPVSLGRIRVTPRAEPAGDIHSSGTEPNEADWRDLSESDSMWRFDPETNRWRPVRIQGAWTPRLDWTDTWEGYAGLGDFVQLFAARFEDTLQGAAVSGPVRVVTEQVLNNRTRLNWQDHPWNAANGGHLPEPAELWDEPAWIDLIVKRAVYVWRRHGVSPRVTGLYLDISRASPMHVEWIEKLTGRLGAELPGVPVFCPSPGLPERRETGRIEEGRQGWQKPDGLPGAGKFLRDEETRVRTSFHPPGQPAPGKSVREETTRGVILAGPSNEGFDAAVHGMRHWSQQEILRLDVEPRFSPGIHPVIQVQVRTAPDRVFASETRTLHNREPNRVFIPLDDPGFWRCFQEPGRAWTPLERMNISEVTLRVFSDRPDPEARFHLRQVATVTRPLSEDPSPVQLTLNNLEAPGGNVTVMQRQDWRFDLDRFFRNPYDPDEIAVDLEITLPDGTAVSHPGFFYQEVTRRYENEVESWELGTHTDWRVRFRPWLSGTHEWTLTVTWRPPEEQKAIVLERKGMFDATAEKPMKGFVRQSEQDPRYFEFQDGGFFYPVGHTMRSPSDRRPGIYDRELEQTLDAAEAKGTELYADWFRRLTANGGNFARIWMSNWWLGLEWNSSHSGYHGRKYYNQQNAARLDRLLELAETHGVYLNLETVNHGTFSSRVDSEWQDNPWSVFSADEGPIRYASEFFLDDGATRWHRNKMRYLIARAGHSPAIAFWGVLTETEWTESYNRTIMNLGRRNRKPHQPYPYRTNEYLEPFKKWVQETAQFIKRVNAHPTVATTHFSNPRNGHEFWKLPQLSVVYNNAYTGFFREIRPGVIQPEKADLRHRYPGIDRRNDPREGIVSEIHGYAEYFEPHARKEKIVIVGEWGGKPSNNRDSHLIAEFHSGTWASVVSNLGGVGGFWWYNLVDFHDLFPRYRAVAAFMEGEDLRGKDFEGERWPVVFPAAEEGAPPRLALGKSTHRKAFVYVYPATLSHTNNSIPPAGFDDKRFSESGPGWLAVSDRLDHGEYEVEFRNTFTGEILETRRVILNTQNREIALPSHRVDLVLKLTCRSPAPNKKE